MMNAVLGVAFAVSILAGGVVHAADTAPHIEGELVVTLDKGMLEGRLCVSGLADADEYEFLLNRGLNIRAVRGAPDGDLLAYDGFFNPVVEGDAIRYTISESTPGPGFCVEYVGAYPVFDVDAGEHASIDWKGQVAFDGNTVRAAEQSRFYPVPIDPPSGAPLEHVSYDIRVDCAACKAIYLNGSAPVGGRKARFSSETARQLLLYAGDYPVHSAQGAHFLGAAITVEEAAAADREIALVARTLEDYLGIPYDEKPTLLSFASVSREHALGEMNWAFMTWPTIALDGRRPFSALLVEDDGALRFTPEKQLLISHEMAHHYFGGRYMPRGPLLNFLLESTAEFFALKAIRQLQGESAYEAQLRTHYEEVAASEVVPLDRVERPEQLSGDFPFRVGPLLLVALEAHVGEEVLMRALSTLVLDAPREPVDYSGFRARLLAAGADEDALERFEQDCLRESVADSCLNDRFSGDADG